MTTEASGPPLPTPHPDEPDQRSSADESSPESAPSPPSPPRTDSSDELSAMLAAAKPDPFLDQLGPGNAPAPDSSSQDSPAGGAVEARSEGRPDSAEELALLSLGGQPTPPPTPEPPGSFDAVSLGALGAEPASVATSEQGESVHDASPSSVPPDEQAVVRPPSSAFGELPGTLPSGVADAEAPPFEHPFANLDVSQGTTTAATSSRVPSDEDELEDEEYDDVSPRGASWPVVLLASYASAVTIGLVWILWGHRTLKEKTEDDSPPVAESKADPGRRAANSRKFTPPSPLSADRITKLGRSVRTGGLQVTPVEVRVGRVHLSRAFGNEEERDGGAGALKLRLRLRNVSKDVVFAPLDEAFVREREAGVFDSFIERSDGQVIDMYPLSVFSEWAIDGQVFKELKPGETLDTLVVSQTDAFERKSPEMLWRIRLRTGIEKTDTIGVSFRDSDIKSQR